MDGVHATQYEITVYRAYNVVPGVRSLRAMFRKSHKGGGPILMFSWFSRLIVADEDCGARCRGSCFVSSYRTIRIAWTDRLLCANACAENHTIQKLQNRRLRRQAHQRDTEGGEHHLQPKRGHVLHPMEP
eukprot:175829-Pyramimonas_sp.AAC.2